MDRKIRIGAFQFAAGARIEKNLEALKRGIEQAAASRVRLLLTQECALCGYPPVETPSVKAIDRQAQDEARKEISALAGKHGIHIALGQVFFLGNQTFNSLQLISPEGEPNPPYHKRALWGWDADNFSPGAGSAVHEIDGIRIGLNICYEVRFPEYFRELFRQDVDLSLIAFADVGSPEMKEKIGIIRSVIFQIKISNCLLKISH